MEDTKRPITNIVILAALMIAGFFVPLVGLIGMITILFSNDQLKTPFNKDEKTMALFGTIVIGIYFIINIIYGQMFPVEDPETSSELLRLLFVI